MDEHVLGDTSTEATAGGPARMRREFSLGSALTLGFVFVSPIVAMYTVFGAGVGDVGPGFWWGWIVALTGQLLVAVTFGVLASRWPMAGGVYQWSRRLVGPRYGWFAGWAYIWTLIIAMTGVSYGGALFVAIVFGVDPANTPAMSGLGVLLIVVAIGVNLVGRRAVRVVAYACIVAEVVGSVGIGLWLLLFHRVNDVTVLGDPISLPPGAGLASAPLVLATMYAGWTFLGFESASTLAEEVAEPRRNTPKAIVGSLLGVGLVVLFTGFAVILAMPKSAAKGGDPIVATLRAYLPGPLFTIAMALFVIAYIACLMAINSAVARIIWSYGRDGELPASRRLGVLAPRTNTPVNASLLAGAVAIVLYLPFQNEHIYTLLVTFVTAGFFISFGFPVLGLATAKFRGTWDRAEPTYLGAFGHVAGWLALAWLVVETVNIVLPRTGDPTVDWAPFAVSAVIFLLGAAVRRAARTQRRIASPKADTQEGVRQ